MKTVIKGGIEYTIDEANGKIVAKLTNCKTEFYNFCKKRFHWKGFTINDIKYVRDTYYGESRCRSEDTYNEQFGMDLARTRAIVKRETHIKKFLDEYSRDVCVMFDELCKLLEKRNAIWQHCSYNYHNLGCYEESLEEIEKIHQSRYVSTLNGEVSMHLCTLCNHTEVINLDDQNFRGKEEQWLLFRDSNGVLLETCNQCAARLRSLK